MIRLSVDLYRDRWVLASSEQIQRGLTLDVPPIRVIPHSDVEGLRSALSELAREEVHVVPQPDWNEPRFTRHEAIRDRGTKVEHAKGDNDSPATERRERLRQTKKLVGAAGLEHVDSPPLWYSKTASVYLHKRRWAVPSRAYFVKWLEIDIGPVAILEANDLSGLSKAVSTVLEASLRLIGTAERSRGSYGSACVSAALGLATSEELV